MKIYSLLSIKKFFLWALLLSWGFVSGCSHSTIATSTQKVFVDSEKKHTLVKEDIQLLAQAEQAWSSKNMLEVQRLYGLLITKTEIQKAKNPFVWERLIQASMANGYYQSTLDVLNQWKSIEPTIDIQSFWQEAWGISMLKIPRVEAINQAEHIWKDSSAPIPLRGLAGGVLMILCPQNMKASLASNLSALYNKADNAHCMMLEQRLFFLFQQCSCEELMALEALTSPERDYLYPWSIIVLEIVHREWKNKDERTADLLGRINYPGVFTDTSLLISLFSSEQSQLSSETTKESFFYPGCYTLVLPMSGPYASIGWKIAKGANVAQEELIHLGINTEVIIINTETGDWLQKLEQVPEQCIVVGGPVRAEAYTELKKRQYTSTKIFFTFLPSLELGDEGRVAWRFFPSPEDQISVLLCFTHDLNITSCGVLYPEDDYGKKMAKLFIQLAENSGISIVSAGYDPDDTASWSKVLTSFTRTQMIGKVPVPSTPFQAVFLPDSWKHIEILMPYLFFQGEDRLVLMGTSLWEQGLSSIEKNNVRNMELAVFPGGWNKTTPSATAATLIETVTVGSQEEPDFWVGLGYDFIRFSAALNIHTIDWTAKELDTCIEKAQHMSWSIAPITWNNGKAQQKLFLFRPTDSGGSLLNLETFKQRLNVIKKRHARRVSAAEKEAAIKY